MLMPAIDAVVIEHRVNEMIGRVVMFGWPLVFLDTFGEKKTVCSGYEGRLGWFGQFLCSGMMIYSITT